VLGNPPHTSSLSVSVYVNIVFAGNLPAFISITSCPVLAQCPLLSSVPFSFLGYSAWQLLFVAPVVPTLHSSIFIPPTPYFITLSTIVPFYWFSRYYYRLK
jgi:hypothetical protein